MVWTRVRTTSSAFNLRPPDSRMPAAVHHGKDDDLVTLLDEEDAVREPAEQGAARPTMDRRKHRRRALHVREDDIYGTQEFSAKPGALILIPVMGVGEVGSGRRRDDQPARDGPTHRQVTASGADGMGRGFLRGSQATAVLLPDRARVP
jgi:hypothetical protein